MIPVPVTLLITAICSALGTLGMTTDTEYLTGWVTQVEYNEPWTEEYWVTVTDYNSKGEAVGSHLERRTTRHSAAWYLLDSNGSQHSIDKGRYQEIVRLFDNEREEDQSRSDQTTWSSLRGEGDIWYSDFRQTSQNLVHDPRLLVVTTEHRYHNRVQASKSVFNFPEVEPKGLFKYPDITLLSTPSILGTSHPQANDLLCRYNGVLGRQKQLHMWILVFQGQNIQRAIDQQNYWKNGNKNELVLCIGLNKNKVDWAYVFSWCENEQLKANIKMFAQSQENLDLVKVVHYMAQQAQKDWKRKEFADFNYLTVELSPIVIFMTFCFVVIANAVMCVVFIQNDFNFKHGFNQTSWSR